MTHEWIKSTSLGLLWLMLFVMCIFYKDALSSLVQGLLCFWHLFPPWMQPPWSVYAVLFLPPVTSSISAKLWQARPYGLSLTKDMTAKLIWLKQKENTCRPTISWCVAFGFIKHNTLKAHVLMVSCLIMTIFQILLGVSFILVALLFIIALFISK